MLEVQKLFKEHFNSMSTNGMEHFRADLAKIGVDVRDYPEYEFMHLDYNTIECIKNHPIVVECRGIIMDYDGNIMCKSFDRFFNLFENNILMFDFANSVAFEKADGSLVRIYFNTKTNKFEIATRGTAFAEGPHEWHGTFRGYILHCMQRSEAQFQEDCSKNLNPNVTYIFECCGPSNRIVTKYNEDQLVYLTAIDTTTFKEYLPRSLDIENFNSFGWNVRGIKQYSFATQADCLSTLGDLPDLGEGYVVYNKLTGARIKIKSPAYVAAHRLRGNGLTTNAVCELVAMNEVDEYVAVFPEDTHKFKPAQEVLTNMVVQLINNYQLTASYMTPFEGTPSAQKEFALHVKDMPLNSVMFKARSKNEDITKTFNDFPVSKRASWIKERLLAISNKIDVVENYTWMS